MSFLENPTMIFNGLLQIFLADGYEQLNKLDSAEKLVQMLEKKHGSDPA
jgi:hypothetical protein